MKEIKRLQAKGLYDRERDDPFELFISSTKIRWCYYKETQRILGSTCGMCVLQDFEAVTPNILCRTLETVEGGGVTVLLLRTMTSLRQLYTMTMDAHARFRTEAHADVTARFNERFLLSLASCASCLVLDDELNVLPVSRHAARIVPLPTPSEGSGSGGGASRELLDLKDGLAGTELVGAVVSATRTLDQARAVLTFCEAISEKTLRTTVALTAGRGRGKSAALGLAMAAAIGYGYSNVFVTSPSPENLGTLFEFVVKGLEALAYKEHADFEAVASTGAGEGEGCIVRINVFRGHRQTIQYISPADAAEGRLGSAELLVVDEAAAIPLPVVKRLLGPYLVFLASTVNGYEGTGRSLSLKLVSQLRQQQPGGAGGAGAGATSASTSASASAGSAGSASASASASAPLASARGFREVVLSEPIRYAAGCPIEKWLNELCCLEATAPPKLSARLPPPSACSLYAVNRDALFSYHKLSEAFLHRAMSLYVSSHYKNSPNDLQLLSDAPAHRLYVLLGPSASEEEEGAGAAPALPDVLVVIQVCYEGLISRESVRAALGRGGKASGDLIPWTVSQQFGDEGFAGLSGARIVRIATHPDAAKMGYGTRALELLTQYYSGRLITHGLGEEEGVEVEEEGGGQGHERGGEGGEEGEGGQEASLQREKLLPRKTLPPLLLPLTDVKSPPRLQWLGTSYGLTLPLFNFWAKGGLLPVYLRATANEVTSENTCIMLREVGGGAGAGAGPRPGWAAAFAADFSRRFMGLLGCPEFRGTDLTLALTVLDCGCGGGGVGGGDGAEEGAGGGGGGGGSGSGSSTLSTRPLLTPAQLSLLFTPHDLARIDSYARGQIDYHVILDLLPALTRLAFSHAVHTSLGSGFSPLPRLQSAILLRLGLQRGSVESAGEALGLAPNQVLALLSKGVKRVSGALREVVEGEVGKEYDAKVAAGAAALAAGRKGGGACAGAAGAGAAGAGAAAEGSRLSAAAVSAILQNRELRQYVVPGEALEAALSGAAAKRAQGGSRVQVEGGGAEAGAGAGVPAAVQVKRPAGSEEGRGGGGKKGRHH